MPRWLDSRYSSRAHQTNVLRWRAQRSRCGPQSRLHGATGNIRTTSSSWSVGTIATGAKAFCHGCSLALSKNDDGKPHVVSTFLCCPSRTAAEVAPEQLSPRSARAARIAASMNNASAPSPLTEHSEVSEAVPRTVAERGGTLTVQLGCCYRCRMCGRELFREDNLVPHEVHDKRFNRLNKKVCFASIFRVCIRAESSWYSMLCILRRADAMDGRLPDRAIAYHASVVVRRCSFWYVTGSRSRTGLFERD